MVSIQKKLQNYLILNKYLSSLFNFQDINNFREILKSIPEGISSNNRLFFTERLQLARIPEDIKLKLNNYDENIQHYLNAINRNRDEPLVLKYFQYIAILFTEVYLDRYFNEFDTFYRNFITYIFEQNTKEKKTNVYTYPYPSKKNLRKLSYWSATGSGKTYIMHINFLQIQRYSKEKYDNYLLISPNEGLSEQHKKELKLSNIDHLKFDIQKTLDEWILRNQIKIIEITKIKEEISSQDGKSVPVDAFGENNVIFVDEGHKGHSTEAKAWKKLRNKLVEMNGFTFEYSATFGEITAKDDTFNEYACTIIFDYRYKYFYEDGFGKDYSILNLKNKEDYGDEYFTGAILSFYEQKIYFNNYSRQLKKFNIENPLMIFVGSSVSGKENRSDVLKIVEFLSRFVNEKDIFEIFIKKILTDKSSLVDTNNNPLFETKFPYLRDLINRKKISLDTIYNDILKLLFHIKTTKMLQLIELKNARGEIGLKFDADYFGVINIGDTDKFLKLIEKNNDRNFFQIGQKSNFEQSLFYKIEKKNSPINFLIGAKKFIEGWNSYRVSIMGLLNVGKSEGTQIMQLFGRGIRLKGYENLLKRSQPLVHENLIPANIILPPNLSILETLNIFGMNSNYMEIFRKTLKEEGIQAFEKITLTIKPTLPDRILYIPRSHIETSDFNDVIQITEFNQDIPRIRLDLSSKIITLESIEVFKQVDMDSPIRENTLDHEIISLVNFDEIYLELLKYKNLKKYYNIYFTKSDLVDIIAKKNYVLICKEEIIKLTNHEEISKIDKIQRYITQLLKTYFDKIYYFEKNKWYQKNLQYETISHNDRALFPREYIFTIDSNATSSIKNISDFSNQFRIFIRKNSEDEDIIYEKDIPFQFGLIKIVDFLALNIHLFKPLIYMNSKNKDLEFIKISPINLVDSERNFILKLDKYLKENQDNLKFDEIYLLRNPSIKGINFFETKNFYPDFVLWTIKNNKQTISFIEPHGLIHEDLADEKFNLYIYIKEIERNLYEKTKLPIKLNSFIISPTEYKSIKWNVSKEELNNKNILFLEDDLKLFDQLFQKII